MTRSCSVCEGYTELCCSDCMWDTRGKVYVCTKTACRDTHECVRCTARCLHPIVVDMGPDLEGDWARECALCGEKYNRSEVVLRPLREAIWERHRLPSSPWSAEERAREC